METCEVPCRTVKDELRIITDSIKDKVSLKVFMWVVAGIVMLSGVLLNAKMETINVKMQTIQESIHDIKGQIIKMNGHTARRLPTEVVVN